VAGAVVELLVGEVFHGEEKFDHLETAIGSLSTEQNGDIRVPFYLLAIQHFLQASKLRINKFMDIRCKISEEVFHCHFRFGWLILFLLFCNRW
jgi:hypothetical protein